MVPRVATAASRQNRTHGIGRRPRVAVRSGVSTPSGLPFPSGLCDLRRFRDLGRICRGEGTGIGPNPCRGLGPALAGSAKLATMPLSIPMRLRGSCTVFIMQAYFRHFGHLADFPMDSGSWVSVHRIGARRVVRRSGRIPGRANMDSASSFRDFVPRLVLGLFIAVAAAAGAFALS